MPEPAGHAHPHGHAPSHAQAGPEGQSRKVKLAGVARVIAVVSGKGGVGKSTVATNLALALKTLGKHVGYADVDIYGPSAPMMLGVHGQPQPSGEGIDLIRPLEAHGIKVMSMGFFLTDSAPVVWRGPMAMSATKQFLRGVDWGDLDYLVVDLPPGTGDIPLTLAQEVPIDGAIVVTTPQDVALADVERSISMLAKVHAPVLGIVQNMSGYVCPKCSTRDDLFGDRAASDTAARLGAPVLAEIPIDPLVCESGDAGTPIVERDPEHAVARAFLELAGRVEVAIERRAGESGIPEPVEIVHDKAHHTVNVEWSDGVTTIYTLRGLRGWCPCAVCQGHAGTTRFVEVDDPKLVGAEGVGRYGVRFIWEDGHDTGMYSYEYLRGLADYEECRPR